MGFSSQPDRVFEVIPQTEPLIAPQKPETPQEAPEPVKVPEPELTPVGTP